MKFQKITLLIIFLLLSFVGFSQQKEVTIKVNKVSDNVYMLVDKVEILPFPLAKMVCL